MEVWRLSRCNMHQLASPSPASNLAARAHYRSPCRSSRALQPAELHPYKILAQHRRLPVQLQAAATDYTATAADDGVLQMPLKQELRLDQVSNVFGYPRDLRNRYNIGGVLGAGSFGIVRTAADKSSGVVYACKTIPKIPKRGRGTPRYLLKLQQEVDAMQQLGASLDAVFLKDVFEDDNNIHLVMEMCTGGGILERIKTGDYTEKRIAGIIRSVLRFIAQCHAKGIIYRDVKPDNFLFLNSNPDAPVKATDMGLSIRYSPGEPKLKSRSGTPVYMAPDVILQEYDHQADCWSVGILMYQLLTGRFPFWEQIRNLSLQQVWQAILSQHIDWGAKELRGVSPAAKELLKGLLVRDPALRLTASQALEHDWLKGEGGAPEAALEGTVVQRLQRYATYGNLKQLVLCIITDEMQDQGAAAVGSLGELRHLFDVLDSDDSGTIMIGELSSGLHKQGYDVSGAEFEQLMERIDVNSDGHINFDEFAAGLLDWKEIERDGQWSRWIDTAFARLDINGDGYIDLEEIVAKLPMMASRGEEHHEERLVAAKRCLREADTNGDGKISKKEFVDLLVGTQLSDDLDQYDSRVIRHATV